MDAMMRDFAWVVHDFQRLAHALSLLVSALETSEDVQVPNFYTDIDTVTNPRPVSVNGKRVAAALSDDDRKAMRALKGIRDDLVYHFFLEHRIDRSSEVAPEAAVAKLRDVQAKVAAAQEVLERLYKALSSDH